MEGHVAALVEQLFNDGPPETLTATGDQGAFGLESIQFRGFLSDPDFEIPATAAVVP